MQSASAFSGRLKSHLAIRSRRDRSASPGPRAVPAVSAPLATPSTALSSDGLVGGPAADGGWVDEILFPRVFEDAWGTGSTDGRTDLDRARIFLVRFGNMTSDQAVKAGVHAIAADRANHSIPQLATAVQARLMGPRHTSFEATPLLQCVRFILIKHLHSRPRDAHDPANRPLLDFFFDPVIARTAVPPPADAVRYPYPASRLKVTIVGGGPTALASAISLAEKGKGKVEVHVWERRWVPVASGPLRVDWPPSARRRDQVVTLQESVTTLLSEASRQALFQGRPECVWPGSANIQIRKVEDRLLRRCHDNEFDGLIHLHARGLSRETLHEAGDFHVLLGADGAASWVRHDFFRGYEHERGRSYALGLAFDRPAGLPWSQPLNVFLTLGQTRYLLNASDHDGRGYLNMQLTEDEWHRMLAIDGEPVTFGHPGCLRRVDGSVPEGFAEGQVFAPSENRDSSLWRSISDGLRLFGFKESEVINVVRIPIVVQAVKEGVRMLSIAGDGEKICGATDLAGVCRPHALVAVAGDAAMTVHFWPGRGLNSGIKSGIALGDEIVHALERGQFVGLPLDAMREYNSFILKLQNREHDKRSIPILNQSGTPETLGWLLSKASSVPDEVAVEWLVGAMAQIAERLEQRPDWAFEPVANVEPQLRIVLRQLHSDTLREMAVSFPWPTREMGGAEVLPVRSMRPEEKQRWIAQLWGMLREDRKREAASSSAEPRAARFEAPRQQPGQQPPRAPSPSPPTLSPPAFAGGAAAPDRAATLRRSNATRSGSVSGGNHQPPGPNLGVPVGTLAPDATPDGAGRPPSRSGRALSVPEEGQRRTRSPSPGPPPTGEVPLARLLTVHRRPGKTMLSDAMSLALFRVDGAD